VNSLTAKVVSLQSENWWARKRNKAKQSKAEQSKTKQSKARQCKTTRGEAKHEDDTFGV
jgi:hypothetical protein